MYRKLFVFMILTCVIFVSGCIDGSPKPETDEIRVSYITDGDTVKLSNRDIIS